MKNVTHRLFLVSTYLEDQDESYNEARLEDAKRRLAEDGLMATEVEGMYEGVPEQALAVYADLNAEKLIAEVALEHQQEAYLVVYDDGYTELVRGGVRSSAGKWIEIDPRDEGNYTGFTRINGKSFTLK